MLYVFICAHVNVLFPLIRCLFNDKLLNFFWMSFCKHIFRNGIQFWIQYPFWFDRSTNRRKVSYFLFCCIRYAYGQIVSTLGCSHQRAKFSDWKWYELHWQFHNYHGNIAFHRVLALDEYDNKYIHINCLITPLLNYPRFSEY